MYIQDRWEIELEDALCAATPADVLTILRKIKMWIAGYCITCGKCNDMDAEPKHCNCLNKGDWYG